MDSKHIPRSASKNMLPGLKLNGLVQLRCAGYSQNKNTFQIKYIPSRTVGRVKRIYDMGKHLKEHRFIIYLRIPGHPVTNFWAEELVKVKV